MEIKTKFNVGDRVWKMMNNSPKELRIHKIIIITAINSEIVIKYYCMTINTFESIECKEIDLYNTKEELKNKVFEEFN